MARSFAGGTDRIAFQPPSNLGLAGCAIGFRFRTTQATNAVQLASKWSATSRLGWAFILTSAGRIEYLAYDNTTQQILLITGATGLNDGNWHSVVANISTVAAGTTSIYVDGSLYQSGNNAGNHGNNSNPVTLGDSYDAFWASYIGSIADVGYWFSASLTTDEIASYAKGFSPALIRPDALEVYAPMVRDYQCKVGTPIAASGFSGTTVSDHPRVMGSLT